MRTALSLIVCSLCAVLVTACPSKGEDPEPTIEPVESKPAEVEGEVREREKGEGKAKAKGEK